MTAREAELLDFIRHYQGLHRGVSPSFGEMMVVMGLRAKSGVHRMLTSLERQGRIRRVHNQVRSITVVEAGPISLTDAELLAEVARRGLVQAAQP